MVLQNYKTSLAKYTYIYSILYKTGKMSGAMAQYGPNEALYMGTLQDITRRYTIGPSTRPIRFNLLAGLSARIYSIFSLRTKQIQSAY